MEGVAKTTEIVLSYSPALQRRALSFLSVAFASHHNFMECSYISISYPGMLVFEHTVCRTHQNKYKLNVTQ